jgi:ribose transport system ATP-binding protein
MISDSTASPNEEPPVLDMQGITMDFPGVRALDGVDLQVRAGEVRALLGENGAGKSTLMNVLSGVFRHYGGSIKVAGEESSIHAPADAQRLGIAMIHQELTLVPELSVADNVFLGREPRTPRGLVDRKTMAARTRDLLDTLGLRVDPSRPVRHYRVGEQQLIELAKALTMDVWLLVMDEPTSALADAEVRRLLDVIRGLRNRGVAVIYISHRLEELYAVADTVTVLRDGRLIGTERMNEVSHDRLIEMMVGRPLGELFPRAPQSGSTPVERLRVDGLSLGRVGDDGGTELNDVSFTVRAGEIVGLAGLMGAGRSEVLEAIYGAHAGRLPKGALAVDGRPYRPRSPRDGIRAGIAFVPEDRKQDGLVLQSSVRFNTSLSVLGQLRRWLTVDRRRERALVREQIKALRIKSPSMSTPVQTLSGGNQQKVVLAKCLLTKPKIILLDEPTRGIDVNAKAEIYSLMNQLATEGVAIVVASSELPELLAMCDRIVVLCEGRVTGEFSGSEASQEAILAAAVNRRSSRDKPTPTSTHQAAQHAERSPM